MIFILIGKMSGISKVLVSALGRDYAIHWSSSLSIMRGGRLDGGPVLEALGGIFGYV